MQVHISRLENHVLKRKKSVSPFQWRLHEQSGKRNTNNSNAIPRYHNV